ncbi:hypothetical protein JVU11DRAFT_3947 [Chiua virens]|nr:hypothetical protein JVU11DRAFT_3947 [Chiua virens]
MGALRWLDHKDKSSEDDEKILSVTDLPIAVAHGGSSLGNVDLISPTEFPLPPTHPLSPYAPVSHPLRAGYVNPPAQLPSVTTAPKIIMDSRPTMLCAHPGELYLGASSSQGRMKMFVYHDRNVFDDGVTKEWLDEVKAAVLWYLGQTHLSCRARRNGVDHDERHGGTQAKL